MIFGRVKELEKRAAELERNAKVHTWKYGEVDLAKLARIVEQLDAKTKAADEATSTARGITPDI